MMSCEMFPEIAREYLEVKEIFGKIGFDVIGTKIISESETGFLVKRKRKFKKLFGKATR